MNYSIINAQNLNFYSTTNNNCKQANSVILPGWLFLYFLLFRLANLKKVRNKDNLDKSKLQSKSEKNNSVVVSTKIFPKTASTYQLAFVPTKPSAIKRPQMVSIDVSDIGVGSKVTHKAFGVGMVLKIKDGLITVDFNGAEKRFQFPTAFQNRFLKKN